MKKKDKQPVWKDIRKMVRLSGRQGLPHFILVVLKSITDGFHGPLFALFGKSIIDYALNGLQQELKAALVFFSLSVLSFIIGSILSYHLNKKAYLIGMEIKRGMFNRFMDLPVSYFETHHSGDTIARINGDTDLFLNSLTMVQKITSNFISTAIMLPTILVIDIRMGILASVVGTMTAYINKRFRIPIRDQNQRIREQESGVLSEIIENISGFRVIKTYRLEKAFMRRFDEKQEEVIRAKKKNVLYNSILHSSNNLIYQLNNSAVIIYGTYMIIMGALTVGALVALRQLGVQIGYLLINTTENISMVQNAFAGSDRIMEFLDQPMETKRMDADGIDCDGHLCLRDVRFSYDRETLVLNGLSMKVRRGEKVALVGYSGHGKSTVIKLLLGLYDITEGGYSFAGKSIREYTKKEIREKMSYVSQGDAVFNGTIRENIGMGRPDAGMDEIMEAAKKAHAHEFIMEQACQYDTVVGERGIRLSGGQKQRIAIARAILKDGEVFILDEATSSLDSESEAYIQDALQRFMHNRTSIIIAHRLSTIEKCDRIYFIENGKVTEEGSHMDLLSLKGRYASLYYKDFKDSCIGDHPGFLG
ncbi:MAG: ABC transporter ATP-binding protein [Clostridia bacterium]